MRYSLLVCFVIGALQAAEPKKITYVDHVLPLLKDKCISCHNVDKKRGGLILNNYLKVMEGGSSGKAVQPGDPSNSLLFKLVTHQAEPHMPPRSPKLPQKTLDLFEKWIEGGALENASSKAVVTKPKVDITLPSVVRGKPTGPPPMPSSDLRLEPVVVAPRTTAVTAIASSPWAPLIASAGQ